MKILNSETLDKMWNVAESDSLETGTPVHQIFAKLMYNKITKEVTDESH